MKHKLIFAILLTCICMPMFASENYFRPGTAWVMECWTFPNNEKWLVDEFIENEIIVDGQQVLPLYFSKHGDKDSKTLLYYVRSEGDKVYWRYIEHDYPEWHLMYDFSLADGETSIITRLSSNPGSVSNVSVKCLRTEYDPTYKSDIMEMEQIENHIPGIETGVWIKGIGSLTGPTINIFGLDGATSRVIEVKSNDTTVFQAPTSSVKENGVTEANVEINGSEIILSGVKEGECVNIYDLNGKLIKSSTINSSVSRVPVEFSGVILVSIGAKTFKLLVN